MTGPCQDCKVDEAEYAYGNCLDPDWLCRRCCEDRDAAAEAAEDAASDFASLSWRRSHKERADEPQATRLRASAHMQMPPRRGRA